MDGWMWLFVVVGVCEWMDPPWGVPYLFIHIHFSTQQPTPSPGRNVQIGNHQRRTCQKTRDAFSCDLTNLKRRGDTNVPTRRKNSRRVKKTASANVWRCYVRRANLFFAKNGFKKHFERHHNNQHNGQSGQQFAPRIAFFGWFGLFRFQNNRFNRRRVADVCRRNTDGVKTTNNLDTDFVFGDEHRVVFCRHERRVNVNSLRDNRVPFDDNPINNDRIGFFEQSTRRQRKQRRQNQKFTHFHSINCSPLAAVRLGVIRRPLVGGRFGFCVNPWPFTNGLLGFGVLCCWL